MVQNNVVRHQKLSCVEQCDIQSISPPRPKSVDFHDTENRQRSCHMIIRQINSEVDSDDVQELPDSHNQELTMDELREMHGQEQDIEELVFVDPVQSKDRMTIDNLTQTSV
ncbi:hypothetical protein TNCV_1093471 [Trichonephila clavipes]|nr:hypothetical protein TNCV_1093471 [Trichonephila clavipes]